MRFFHAAILVLFASIIGCDTPPPKPPATEPEIPNPLAEAESIAPGPRPSSIDGAPYFNGADLLSLESTESLNGSWIVVEGPVSRSFDRFGAPCVVLEHESWPTFIDCEGSELGKYRFELGQNIAIRGRLDGTSSLAISSLVTQQQIDDAIRAEDGGE